MLPETAFAASLVRMSLSLLFWCSSGEMVARMKAHLGIAPWFPLWVGSVSIWFNDGQATAQIATIQHANLDSSTMALTTACSLCRTVLELDGLMARLWETISPCPENCYSLNTASAWCVQSCGDKCTVSLEELKGPTVRNPQFGIPRHSHIFFLEGTLDLNFLTAPRHIWAVC